MAKLILKKFRCIEQTETLPDSPYFAVFVGEPSTKQSEVHRVRREAWDNAITAGPAKVANVTVDSTVSPDAVILAALLEEDDNVDLSGATITRLRTEMQTLFSAFATNGSSPAQIAGRMMPEFRRALNTALGNDDLIGIKRVTASSGTKVLNYMGDGGSYQVTFAIA